MPESVKKKIGVISMVRNDQFFIPKWIDYYGSQFGHENLFLILDGHDQEYPAGSEAVNVIRIPREKQTRSRGDKN
ncbi:glycosyltransferase family 2 protein, partial [bacterium]|nr:glycosyltransferase family 2 protein [bacterium]